MVKHSLSVIYWLLLSFMGNELLLEFFAFVFSALTTISPARIGPGQCLNGRLIGACAASMGSDAAAAYRLVIRGLRTVFYTLPAPPTW